MCSFPLRVWCEFQWLLVPRTSSTPMAVWSWPTWVVESETCFGWRVRLVGVVISFEKNFYRLPFTPSSLVASSVLQLVSELVRVFWNSNQSKIQRWRTRNGDGVLHTSMGKTTRCGIDEWLHFFVARDRSFGTLR
jgi:hypothetical protein